MPGSHSWFFLHLAELSACITIYRGHRFDHLAVDVKLRHFPVAASGCSTKSSVFAALGLLLFRATDALSGLPGLLALLSYQSPLILDFCLFGCCFLGFFCLPLRSQGQHLWQKVAHKDIIQVTKLPVPSNAKHGGNCSTSLEGISRKRKHET